MKTNLLSFAVLVLTAFCTIPTVQAQTIYTSRPGGGDWNDPATWAISGAAIPYSVPTNYNGSNNIIIINSAVRLTQDYSVEGNDGMLTINTGGALTEATPGRVLSFGQQQGNSRLRLQQNGLLQMTSVSFLKADATINGPLNTSCNIAIENQSTLNISSTVAVAGNLIVRQGNVSGLSVAGSGRLIISGCVRTVGNGFLNGLFGSNLRVCIQDNPNACDTEGLGCNARALQAITIVDCSAITPLPVELLRFSARRLGQQVQLQWATAWEKQSASFAVERSGTGREFETLQVLPAAGTSTTLRTYSATDARPLAGTSYYRLRQTDLDGAVSYSPVEVVQAPAKEQAITAYRSGGQLNVELNTAGVCQEIRVLDGLGRLLYAARLPAGSTGTVAHQVPLPKQEAGVYVVQALTSQGVIRGKFMLLD